MLQPAGIYKTIFTAPVNANTKYVSKWLEKRIKSKGGVVDKTGITVYLRTSGAIQLIGNKYMEIPGDHNYSDSKDRKNLIKLMEKVLLKQ